MKRSTSIVVMLVAASPFIARVAYAQQSKEQIIAEATKPLPEDRKSVV